MTVIRLDIDCVLADIITPWLAWYNPIVQDNLQYEQITDWDIDKFVKPVWRGKMRHWLFKPEIYDTVPVIKGAQAAVKVLQGYGRVVYVTAEVPGQCGRKFDWLQTHGFKVANKDYVEMEDKSLFRADIAIDDGLHNFHTDDSQGLRILFDQPWNRVYQHWDSFDYRLKGWNLTYLKEIMES